MAKAHLFKPGQSPESLTQLIITTFNCRIIKSAVLLSIDCFVFTEFVDQNQKAKVGSQTQRRLVMYDDILPILPHFNAYTM